MLIKLVFLDYFIRAFKEIKLLILPRNFVSDWIYLKRRIAGYATIEMIQAGAEGQVRWVGLFL